MEYRGYEIEDNVMLPRGVRLDELCDEYTSSVDFGIEELEDLTETLKSKKAELDESGKKYENLRVVFYSTEHCTVDVYLEWSEEETQEEKEKRIRRTKEGIDIEIELGEK